MARYFTKVALKSIAYFENKILTIERTALLDLIQIVGSNFGPNGKRVIATGFELIVPLFQETPQWFLDERPTLGGFDDEAIFAETPLELPNKIARAHLSSKQPVLPRLFGNADVDDRLRIGLPTHENSS
jgi:hypothetical protein